jgi:hypothetical protein
MIHFKVDDANKSIIIYAVLSTYFNPKDNWIIYLFFTKKVVQENPLFSNFKNKKPLNKISKAYFLQQFTAFFQKI